MLVIDAPMGSVGQMLWKQWRQETFSGSHGNGDGVLGENQ